MNRKIFISIAGYRDPLLKTTILEAYNNATHKDNLVFAIVDQSPANEVFKPTDYHFNSQIKYLRLDPSYARGCCFARNLAQSLWAGEEFYFQCDSHTLFDERWDEIFIHAYDQLSEWHQYPVITGYPRGFEAVGNDITNLKKQLDLTGLMTLIADEEHAFKGDTDMYVGTKAHIIDKHEPVHGFMLSANCLFTTGRICEDVPYDPFIYFSGEEHSLALRLWTHGYNIFHIPVYPVYHHYGRDYRTTAWGDQQIEEARPIKWWQYDIKSKERLHKIVTGQDVGVYGLGTVRTLEQYIKYCEIDYHKRTITDKSKWGHGIFDLDWRKPIIQ